MGTSLLVFFTHNSLYISESPKCDNKKKYYEFIQNLPLFLPIDNISTEFSKLIDKYPITPYLDNTNADKSVCYQSQSNNYQGHLHP